MSASATRAVVIHAPHDLRIDSVPVAAPGPGEVRVKIERGGICGSDLHYYHEGGFGTVRVKEPMVLGHEVAGRIEALGTGVTGLKQGQIVAVNPSVNCGQCRFCRAGQPIHCLEMRFYGSAMRFPHVQGGFRESIVCHAEQAVPIKEGAGAEIAAFAEPLAVCLHAIRQAEGLAGARVLVTGCGPIGALTVLAARHAGAKEIIVTDVTDAATAMALTIGADHAFNTAANKDALATYEKDKGQFDITFEASGHPAALAGAIAATRPRGTIVQIGVSGTVPIPLNVIVAKEINLRGTFRFYDEFAWAVDLLGQGKINVKPLLSATIPFEKAVEAFTLASDRSKAMKVQLAF